ncbi:hypothetical protein [Pseudonocardia sp. GCM10023141]|uniref:hypothetical protein n=1 Tax=Pseudonocardia sp. GCM10023141 TaxID=3252653 RepID=UPI003606BA96
MASSRPARRPQRGSISWLPSGSARVKVYAGIDQLTGKKIWLRETVAVCDTEAGTRTAAEKALTKLLNQVDERRSPKTETTVNELLDRWLEVIDIERKTRTGYVGKIEKHIRPTIGRLQVGRVRADTVEGLYAQLRRCRDHCKGENFIQHRTAFEHGDLWPRIVDWEAVTDALVAISRAGRCDAMTLGPTVRRRCRTGRISTCAADRSGPLRANGGCQLTTGPVNVYVGIAPGAGPGLLISDDGPGVTGTIRSSRAAGVCREVVISVSGVQPRPRSGCGW